MLALLQSFVLGFAISALPGAVLFEVIRRALLDKPSVLGFLVGNFSGIAGIYSCELKHIRTEYTIWYKWPYVGRYWLLFDIVAATLE